ncbi:ATP-grasp fold amidoligase family protein [Neobacillus kokaensis]|uniref:Glycosyl transferase n=1 Tax=Neobacillus kokaensis TaxID=2759023 RepID=A0ABQ3N9U2_9BACI|nr:ATP-grasp fold amidoligase family protein [Neobacillus kokaensis]GHH99565.1 glycosyl transferase [Neobacillus kokaensis]
MKKRIRRTKRNFQTDKNKLLNKKFKKIHGYDLNLENPKTFSEKIQWVKYHGKLERFSKYVDKYEVRQYVKEKIGEQYLIPLISVFDNVDQIDWNMLPESFAMKANHASGWNIIVEDKTMVNQESAKNKMRKWLQSSYYKLFSEANYRNIKPRVVIEELIKDPSGDLKDYKFFCFHGEPKFIQVDGDRFTEHKRDLFDLDWNKLPLKLKFTNFKQSPLKPAALNEMIQLARQLSEGLPFVRVDLYYTNDRIYFGELTFTPGNGLERFSPRYYDELFGNCLDINRYI